MEAVNETNNQLQCRECRVVLIKLKVNEGKQTRSKNLTRKKSKQQTIIDDLKLEHYGKGPRNDVREIGRLGFNRKHNSKCEADDSGKVGKF